MESEVKCIKMVCMSILIYAVGIHESISAKVFRSSHDYIDAFVIQYLVSIDKYKGRYDMDYDNLSHRYEYAKTARNTREVAAEQNVLRSATAFINSLNSPDDIQYAFTKIAQARNVNFVKKNYKNANLLQGLLDALQKKHNIAKTIQNGKVLHAQNRKVLRTIVGQGFGQRSGEYNGIIIVSPTLIITTFDDKPNEIQNFNWEDVDIMNPDGTVWMNLRDCMNQNRIDEILEGAYIQNSSSVMDALRVKDDENVKFMHHNYVYFPTKNNNLIHAKDQGAYNGIYVNNSTVFTAFNEHTNTVSPFRWEDLNIINPDGTVWMNLRDCVKAMKGYRAPQGAYIELVSETEQRKNGVQNKDDENVVDDVNVN